MRAEMERCAREGTPRPESQAVRAHVPALFWSFANSWRDIFHNGVCDHAIKELCRLYVSRSVKCEFCGNQRSIKAAKQGLTRTKTDDLVNFEKSTRYNDARKPRSPTPKRSPGGSTPTTRSGSGCTSISASPSWSSSAASSRSRWASRAGCGSLDIEHHQVMAGTDALDGAGLRKRGDAAALQAGRELLGGFRRDSRGVTP